MKTLVCMMALLVAAGCTKLDEGFEEAQQRKPVTLPGMAPLDGLDVGRAGGGSPAPAQPAQPQPPGPRQGIIGKTTNQVVDYHAAMAQNPNLIIVEQRPQGEDPLTFVARAYIDTRSRVSTLGMEHAVRTHRALEDRWPTYDEFIGIMRQHGVHFTMIEPFRMYAYNSQTGEIVVLEDPQEKRRRYEAAGIPLD